LFKMGKKTVTDIHDLMLETREDIGAIKEHLKNLNGKVAKHEAHIDEEFPKMHSEIHQNKTNLKVIFTVGFVLLAIIDIGVRFLPWP